MKLLGHTNPEMTMRYVDVALTDLQREFQLARSNPRDVVPQPRFRQPLSGLDTALLLYRSHPSLCYGRKASRMFAVKQPSCSWNSYCLHWTSSAHISLGSVQETARSETSARRGGKIIYVPTRSSDDSCNT